MKSVGSLFAIILLALPATSGAVTLDAISQSREVEIAIQVRTDICPFPTQPPNGCDDWTNPPTSTTVDDYADVESAPGFGTFDAIANEPTFERTRAAQTSSISPTALVASGSWWGEAGVSLTPFGPPLQFLQVTESHVAQNHYEVTFELSGMVGFSLAGDLGLSEAIYENVDTAEISLVGPGGELIASLVLPDDGDCSLYNIPHYCLATVAKGGFLAPGVYTLRASGYSRSASWIGSTLPYEDWGAGSFNVELLLTAPAVPALPPGGAALLGGGLVAAFGVVRLRFVHACTAHADRDERPDC
jgi:hypothetical protein